MPEPGRAGVEIVRLGLTAKDPVNPVKRGERRRGRFRVGRLAVVDEGDAAARTDPFHPVRQALEARQSAIDHRIIDAERLARIDCSKRVLRIVRPLQ